MANKKIFKANSSCVGNILIYNNENITYYHGKIVNFTNEPIVERYISIEDDIPRTNLLGSTVFFQVGCGEETNNIELDDTTMKRIAKFNKTQECKRLDKEIKAKEEKIKELDDLLHDKEKRWKKVNQYIKNIYDLDLDEDDDDDYEDWDD